MLASLCYAYFVLDIIALGRFYYLLKEKMHYSNQLHYGVDEAVTVWLTILMNLLGFGAVVDYFVNMVVLDLSSGPLIAAACGSGLWDAVMGQFIYFGVLPIAVVGVVGWVNQYKFPLNFELSLNLMVTVVLCVISSVGVYYSFTYARDALGNANCTAALSAVNSLRAPMLAHVAQSHLAFHALVLVVAVVWFLLYVFLEWRPAKKAAAQRAP